MHDIFGHFLAREDDTSEITKRRKALTFWFTESFPEQEFKGEELLFYSALRMSVKISIPFKERYLESFIRSELKPLLAKKRIRVIGTETLSFEDMIQLETATQITGEAIRSYYRGLLIECPMLDEFIVDALDFIESRRDDRVLSIMTEAYEITNGIKDGRVGSADALDYINFETTKIKEIYDKEKLTDLSEELNVVVEGTKKFRFSFYTGITPLDKDMGGAYTSQLIGIEAPPGIGKTRFAVGAFSYQASVNHKQNVYYRALEQTKEEIESLFVSLHVFHLFQIQVNSDLILKEKVPEKYQKKVEAARHDLFESGKYGKILIEDKPLYLESFVNQLKMIDTLKGPFDLIVIDYMALIEQEAPREGQYVKQLQDWQIIQKAYRRFKAYVLHNSKVGLAINQLNAEGTEKARSGKDTDTMDAQGGMEVYRSTDYNIVIGATPEMEAQFVRRLTNPKKRNTGGLGAVLVDVRMAFCYFYIKSNKGL